MKSASVRAAVFIVISARNPAFSPGGGIGGAPGGRFPLRLDVFCDNRQRCAAARTDEIRRRPERLVAASHVDFRAQLPEQSTGNASPSSLSWGPSERRSPRVTFQFHHGVVVGSSLSPVLANTILKCQRFWRAFWAPPQASRLIERKRFPIRPTWETTGEALVQAPRPLPSGTAKDRSACG